MDSVQVGKAVFVKESYATLGIEPRTYSYPGRSKGSSGGVGGNIQDYEAFFISYACLECSRMILK